MVNLMELSRMMNYTLVLEVLYYLYNTLAFGVFLTPYHIEQVFKLSSPDSYIASRLFQGELDARLSRGTSLSSFIPFSGSPMDMVISDTFNADAFMESVASTQDPEMIQNLIRMQTESAQQAFYVDNSTDMMKAMDEAKMLNMNTHYKDYLFSPKHHPNFKKVGQNVFHNIIRAAPLNRKATILGGGQDVQKAERNVKMMAMHSLKQGLSPEKMQIMKSFNNFQ
jgi:hypothetical protein